MKKWIFTAIVFSMTTLQSLYAQGCSQCRMLSEQSSELDEASFGSNINTGILYLMLIPYFLIMFLFRKRIIAFVKSRFSK